MRLIPIALSVGLLITAVGCGSPTADNTAQKTSAPAESSATANALSDNVEELRLLINLPFVPEDVRFQETSTGQNDKKLLAVLLFSKEDSAKFTSQLAAQGKGSPDEISTEDWFPPELLSQSDLGGESTLKGETYKADQLFQPPYTQGKITRIADSDYFVVQLSTK
jgi:hypothetical protein